MGLNSVTASPNENGKVTLNFSPEQDDPTNYVYIMDGWNYVLRQYRPQASVLNKTWTPPTPNPTTWQTESPHMTGIMCGP